MERVLTDDMLNNDLDRAERHVSKRDLSLSPAAPFHGREALQEELDGAEEGDNIEVVLLEVVLDAASALPDALEDELRVLRQARVRLGRSVEVERGVLEKSEESAGPTGGEMSAETTKRRAEEAHLKTASRLPPLKIRRMIMLMNLDSSFASDEERLSVEVAASTSRQAGQGTNHQRSRRLRAASASTRSAGPS